MRTHSLQTTRKTRRIVFLAFPEVVLLDLIGPWDVFVLANRLAAKKSPPYALELVSGDNTPSILAGGGIALASHRTAAACRGPIDTLIIPAAGISADTLPLAHALKVLHRLAAHSQRIVSVCGGSMLLAATGLLDGKRATTHWQATTELKTRFPKVDVQPDAIFVKDGNIYTSAGVTAGIDLALALIEEDLGREVALNCARHLVVFMHRPGGQAQFSATLQAQTTERNDLTDLIAWAADHPAADLSVEAMSRRARMSLRNFSRVFRQEIGQTPAAFAEGLRVDAARRLLEETKKPLERIASDCGFGSADSMRRSFSRVLHVAPSDYRRRFFMRAGAQKAL